MNDSSFQERPRGLSSERFLCADTWRPSDKCFCKQKMNFYMFIIFLLCIENALMFPMLQDDYISKRCHSM